MINTGNTETEFGSMHLAVYGIPDKKERDRFRGCVKRLSEILVGKRITENLSVIVRIKPLEEHYYGNCIHLDDEYHPREFEIEINDSVSYIDRMVTLCHEMVHLKQYARNELREVWRPEHSFRYMKEYYPLDVEPHPWEEEAVREEYKLLRLLIDEGLVDDRTE